MLVIVPQGVSLAKGRGGDTGWSFYYKQVLVSLVFYMRGGFCGVLGMAWYFYLLSIFFFIFLHLFYHFLTSFLRVSFIHLKQNTKHRKTNIISNKNHLGCLSRTTLFKFIQLKFPTLRHLRGAILESNTPFYKLHLQ